MGFSPRFVSDDPVAGSLVGAEGGLLHLASLLWAGGAVLEAAGCAGGFSSPSSVSALRFRASLRNSLTDAAIDAAFFGGTVADAWEVSTAETLCLVNPWARAPRPIACATSEKASLGFPQYLRKLSPAPIKPWRCGHWASFGALWYPVGRFRRAFPSAVSSSSS